MGATDIRRTRAVHGPSGVRELSRRRRRGPGPERIRPELRPAASAQAALRPRESVPTQSEHRSLKYLIERRFCQLRADTDTGPSHPGGRPLHPAGPSSSTCAASSSTSRPRCHCPGVRWQSGQRSYERSLSPHSHSEQWCCQFLAVLFTAFVLVAIVAIAEVVRRMSTDAITSRGSTSTTPLT